MTEKRNIRHNPILFGIVLAILLTIVTVCAVFLQNAPEPDQRMQSPVQRQTLEQIEAKFEPLRQQYMQQRGKIDLGKLITQAKEIAEKHPEFAPGQLFVGQLYFDKGDLPNAQAYIDQSLKLDPDQGPVHLLAGNIALMQKDPKTAADHLSLAVKLEPSNAQYWLYLGQSYFEQSNWSEAEECYEKAYALDSDMILALNGKADCQVKQNQIAQAVYTMQQAIDQTPLAKRKTKVVYLRKQARLLSELGKPNEALVVLSKLTDAEKTQLPIAAQMASYWDQLGEPGKAAEIYEQLLANDLRNWDLAAKAAQWRIKAGHKDKAQQHLLHIQLINPDLPIIKSLQTSLEQLPE
ncbi:MAG: tetratricopeptide repeat protein [Phycisphaeraceae bacterium JB051]